MRFYAVIWTVIVVLIGALTVRARIESDTEPAFHATLPEGHPSHGHEAQFVASCRRAQAEEEQRLTATERPDAGTTRPAAVWSALQNHRPPVVCLPGIPPF